MKRVFLIVLVCAVGIGVFWYYNQRRAERLLASGDTISPDNSAPVGTLPGSEAAPAAAAPPAPRDSASLAEPAAAAATTQAPNTNTARPPAADTISPNPPNGMVFSGTGRFQVYRQGNLTWRVNTDSGQSCILFATDGEWRKPRVYEHGCANANS